MAFPFLEVKGDPWEIGFQIGSRFKGEISAVLEQSLNPERVNRFLDAPSKQLQDAIHLAEENFPSLVMEIRGIAKGSGQPFPLLFWLNTQQDLYQDNLSHNCSTVIFVTPKQIVLGHNEDGCRETVNRCFLLKIVSNNGPSMLVFCYPGILAGSAFGFNEYGLVQTVNAVLPGDIQPGLGKRFIARTALASRSLGEAVEVVTKKGRDSGFSYDFASYKEKKALNIETSATCAAMTEITDRYFHTNHFVAASMGNVPQEISESSRQRQLVGEKLLYEVSDKSVERALQILTDTSDPEFPIWGLGKPPHSLVTLATAVFSLNEELRLNIHADRSLRTPPQTFTLEDLG
jgi:hypothetical protein